MTKIMPKSLKPVYVLPFLFVIYLVSTGFIGHTMYLAPLAAYLLFAAANAASIMTRYREKIIVLPLLILLPFVAHIAYGTGFAAGLLRKQNG